MLRFLQNELPKLWTDELYSDGFRASPSKFQQDLVQRFGAH